MKKVLIIIATFILSCNSKQVDKFNPPTIEESSSEDIFFEKKVIDYYRDLEKTKNVTINNWYEDQTKYANNFLENISGRDSLTKELYKISNRKSFKVRNINITDNNQYFFLRRNTNEEYYKLYYKKNSNSNSELLYDPKDYKSNTQEKYKINFIKPSWDGNNVVISINHSGKELSELIIIDMKTRKPMRQTLKNAWPSNFLGINWLPDNSGFTYLFFPNTDISDPKFKENSQSVLYLLGSPENKINHIFGNKTHPELKIPSKLYPTTQIHSSQDEYLIGYLSEVDSYWDAYYAKISDIKKGALNWIPLYKKSDKVMTNKGYFTKNNFIFLSSKDAPNKKIMSIDKNILNFDKGKTVAPEDEHEVINDFEITKDVIYYSTLKNGVEANLYRSKNNNIEKVEIPKKAGEISITNKSIYSDDLWVTLRGWTNSKGKYKLNINTGNFELDNLSPRIEYPEFNDIISDEILVEGHDGEKIPFSIIYNKNIKRNGKNPVFIYSYGSFGDIEAPYFSPIMLNFVAKGGIYGIAHVRGGGEKGDLWRMGGYKTTKENSWKDLISCTEFLIKEKYTSKEHTAIYGGSAGAMIAGKAMTERPDLFKVVISQVGYLNPLRAEVTGSSGSNSREFGSVKDSIECLSLIKMDPYLSIKENVDYPATLLTVGMNDHLVMPWMTGKFTARLQKASLQKKPVLLLADFDAGHGNVDNQMKIYEEWSNIFSFTLWQTGHPDYQLKE